MVSLSRLGRLPDVGTQWLGCDGTSRGPKALALRAMGARGECESCLFSVGMLIPSALVSRVLTRKQNLIQHLTKL